MGGLLGAGQRCGLSWHLGPHQVSGPHPALHHPSPQPSSSCLHTGPLGVSAPQGRAAHEQGRGSGPTPLRAVRTQTGPPGAGQWEGHRPLPRAWAAPCLLSPQETPGPYRPPGEADLSLVPRPSVRTLWRGSARCEGSRHNLLLSCQHPSRALKVQLGCEVQPLSSLAVMGAFLTRVTLGGV